VSKRKTNLLRVGDKARVIIPNRFIRCGYELTPMIVAEKLATENSEDIVEFLNKLGIAGENYRKTGPFGFKATTDKINIDARGMRMFMKALGYIKVRADGFGGKDRKIFSVPDPILEDVGIEVLSTRQVMTGEYYAPTGSYDWYEPGGLKKQQSNRILNIRICKHNKTYRGQIISDIDDPHQQWKGLWIEANNCEKINEEELV